MEISFVRHGKSIWIDDKPITCREFRGWVDNYNNNGVSEENAYPSETIEKVTNANVVITSNLKRSIVSAQFLHPNHSTISNALFCETELPSLETDLFGLKLKPKVWAVILRLLWFCGYSNGCESLKDAKVRANKASIVLIDYAKEHGNVVLIGHGFFNRLIAKELQKIGWEATRKMSSKHWESTTFLMR